MPGKVPQRSSNTSKAGAGASLGKKITSKSRVKPSPPSQTNGDGQEDRLGSSKQDLKRYNTALEKYQNDDPSLAFMKEENFASQNEDGSEMSITERNIARLGSGSLASRINIAAGRYDPDVNTFGRGRSRLPGDNPDGTPSERLTGFIPRYNLQRSKLIRGIVPDTGPNSHLEGTNFTSRFNTGGGGSAVNNILNGTSANQSPNFEAFSSAYLKENASFLSSKFESDPAFKAKYLRDVEKLYNGLDVRTLGTAPVEERRAKLVGQAGNATARDRMQVANGFMTLLANSGRTVDEVASSGLTVFMADSIVSEGERVAGYFSTANHMVLSRNPGFASFNATAVHELTHVLDNLDGHLDGHMDGLSNNWANLRSEALNKIAQNNGQLPGLESGFVDYSTSNNMEFLSVMSQLYQSDSADMQRNFPQIFSALDRMFRVA